MMTYLVPLALLVLGWWAWKAFPGTIRPIYEQVRGFVGQMLLYAVAVGLALQGRFLMAAAVGAVGIWLSLGGNMAALQALWRGRGQAAVFRSASIELTMKANGSMTGRVLTGALKGRTLEGLQPEEHLRLARELTGNDLEGFRLLESYLDRLLPGWRQHMQPGTSPGEAARPGPRVMSEQEAHEILGLQPGASQEAIAAAYRALMKKLHPDQGGSTWLAARINQAREVLLRRHS
jgi:DNA-binding transcriptional regulator of glucitol operon